MHVYFIRLSEYEMKLAKMQNIPKKIIKKSFVKIYHKNILKLENITLKNIIFDELKSKNQETKGLRNNLVNF